MCSQVWKKMLKSGDEQLKTSLTLLRMKLFWENFKKWYNTQKWKDFKNNGTTWKLVSIPFKWVLMLWGFNRVVKSTKWILSVRWRGGWDDSCRPYEARRVTNWRYGEDLIIKTLWGTKESINKTAAFVTDTGLVTRSKAGEENVSTGL
jgi:hypothetical protein